MSSRKQELLEATIIYLLEHGLAELSLRPLAAAAGTSARLLIYHFGSKERLLVEVLETLQRRLRASFAEVLAARRKGGRAAAQDILELGRLAAEFPLPEAAL